MTTSTMTLLFATLAILAAAAAVVLHAVRWLPVPGRVGSASVSCSTGRRSLWPSSWPRSPRSAASTCLRWPTSSPAGCAGTSASPCTRCRFSSGSHGGSATDGVRRYALPLTIIGMCISTYHILVERFPSLEESGVCEVANPCSVRWVERFGFITIPTMALAAFALISGLLVYPARRHPLPEPDDHPDRPITSEIRP